MGMFKADAIYERCGSCAGRELDQKKLVGTQEGVLVLYYITGMSGSKTGCLDLFMIAVHAAFRQEGVSIQLESKEGVDFVYMFTILTRVFYIGGGHTYGTGREQRNWSP